MSSGQKGLKRVKYFGQHDNIMTIIYAQIHFVIRKMINNAKFCFVLQALKKSCNLFNFV